MVLDIVYVLLFVAWGGLILGFNRKDYTITNLSSIFLICWGLNAVLKGLGGFQDWFTEAFAVINIFTGLYIFIRSSWELYKNY